MSSCPNCGREVCDTAGPCNQCTIVEKNSIDKLKEAYIIGCKTCGSLRISQVSMTKFVCEDCKTVL